MSDTRNCLNGCDRPIAPPSKVICKECQDKITRTLEETVAQLEAQAAAKPKYSLECAECGCDVFERDEDAYSDGESCICPSCGGHCFVSVDDVEDPPVAWCDTIIPPPLPVDDATGTKGKLE